MLASSYSRRSNTRGGQRNSSQAQSTSAQLINLGNQNNLAMMSSSQNFNKKQLSGLLPAANQTGGFPQTTKNNSADKPDLRVNKDVIIRKQSSKSLLSPVNMDPAPPFRQKSQPPRSNPAGALKTDSTAADDQKRKVTHSLGN